MKKIHYILLILLVYSCGESVRKTSIPIMVVGTETSNSEAESKPYSNPVLIYGSSFGAFFQALYRTNQFDKMLDFTSTSSRRKFGDKVLLEFYRNDLKLDFDLGNLTAIEKSNNTTYLIYAKASIIARRKVVIPILIENDSCKIIINSLKNSLN